MPLHEVCAHACDVFCPYPIRASFLDLLLEAYTVTSLKVLFIDAYRCMQPTELRDVSSLKGEGARAVALTRLTPRPTRHTYADTTHVSRLR